MPEQEARQQTKPGWSRYFPVEWKEDQFVTRREFTKFLALASFGLFAGSFTFMVKQWWRGMHPKKAPEQLVAMTSDVPAGGVKLFRYPTENDPCIMIRDTEGNLRAYNQKCTHLACAVVYQKADNKIHCPCHHGFFDVKSGDVLAGPPQRRLERIALQVRGSEIWATGVE